MKLRMVVGLGNPGERYAHTRHNVGFDTLDALARAEGLRFRSGWLSGAQQAVWKTPQGPLRLVKPQQFMNCSGPPSARIATRRRIEPQALLVVFDDVELPLGKLRFRKQGGAGGHKGLASMIEALGTQDFPRLRIGVGPRPAGENLVEYVLSKWPENAIDTVSACVGRTVEAVRMALDHGLDRAMNTYNS